MVDNYVYKCGQSGAITKVQTSPTFGQKPCVHMRLESCYDGTYRFIISLLPYRLPGVCKGGVITTLVNYKMFMASFGQRFSVA